MKKLKFILCAVALLFACGLSSAQVNHKELQIGISTSGNFQEYEDFLLKTISDLQGALTSSYSLKINFLNDAELANEIHSNRLDLVIAPSSFARTYMLKGAKDIASLEHENTTNPNRADASVFLVDGQISKVKDLQELRGATVITSKEFGLSGYDSLASLIIDKTNENPDKFFGKIVYVKPDIPLILEKLKSGEANVAIIPACSLERYSLQTGLDTSWIRVLSPRQDSDLSCYHSVYPFPGITVISMPSLSPYDSKVITTTLLDMDVINGMGWGLATDFSGIDKVLSTLKNGPWERGAWNITDFIKTYWRWFVALLAAIVVLILHSVRSEMLVRKRTGQLSKALEAQRKMNLEANLANRKYEKLQKISVIGQMSSLFAHELRQPLNAINCYSSGLRRFMKDPEKAKKFIEKGLKGIEEEAERASEIVERVRIYAKNNSNRQVLHDVKKIIDRSIADFQTTSVGEMKVSFIHDDQPYNVRGDEFELELIITNLLRNSAQAQAGQSKTYAWIELSKKGNYVKIDLWDRGAPLTEEKIQEIALIGDTTKSEGMGLGLSIIKSLVSAHSGEIQFTRSKIGGLQITILLPEVKLETPETSQGE